MCVCAHACKLCVELCLQWFGLTSWQACAEVRKRVIHLHTHTQHVYVGCAGVVLGHPFDTVKVRLQNGQARTLIGALVHNNNVRMLTYVTMNRLLFVLLCNINVMRTIMNLCLCVATVSVCGDRISLTLLNGDQCNRVRHSSETDREWREDAVRRRYDGIRSNTHHCEYT